MSRIKESKNKIIVTVTLVCAILLLWIFKIPCPFKHVFEIDCLGCGMSRAYFSLFRFDFKSAFSYHPMFWSVPILYLYFWFDGKLFGKKILDYSLLVLIALGFIINWIAKLW